MLEAASHSLNTLLPNIDPETNQPVHERLKDVKSAKELFDKMRQADNVNSSNRAAIQAMFDGEPPYDDRELIADGQGHRCNLNFAEAARLLENSLGGYVDLINSVDRLIDTPLDRRKYPFSDQTFEWEQIIAEEFTRAIREWDKFEFNFLLLAHYFVGFGLGFTYFENELDWRWNVDSMANIYVPRRTFATESEIEVACCVRCYQAHQLYQKISDPEVAANEGWNVEEVKTAISESCQSSNTNLYQRWEAWEAELKNNDLWSGYAAAGEIRTVHYFVREMDTNKVSHYISLENGDNKQFLYKRLSTYEEMSDVLISFTYGIGTNGYYHGIRGLGYKIFPMIQVSNRARCQFMDGSMMASSVMVQGADEDAMEQMQFYYFGPYSVISPGMNVIQHGNPNLSQALVPVLSDMSSLLNSQSGQYEPSGNLDSKERTAMEVKADVSSKAKLTTTQLNLFYSPHQRHFRKVLKRFIRRGYSEKEAGGKLVHKFLRRCVDRGVPLEAIYNVDCDQAPIKRAIGDGSPEMRLLILEEMERIIPQADEVGRYNWSRDISASRMGYEQVNRYFPPRIGARIAPDTKIAMMENDLMSLGKPQEVLPDQDDYVHAKIHVPAMAVLNEQLQQDPNSLAQVIPTMLLMLQHTEVHVDQMSQSVVLAQEAAQYRQALQQLSEIVLNGALQLQKMQKQAAEQAQAQGGQGEPLNTKLLEDSIRFQEHMKQMNAEHAQKLKQQRELHQQKMAIKDAESAQKILQS